MRKLILCMTAALLLAGATGAQATTFGARAGVSVDPDQIHVGGHMNLAGLSKTVRIVPNIEVGFGDDITAFTFNGDALYDFPGSAFSVGGELGLNVYSWDAPAGSDGSDTKLGLSILGDFRKALTSGNELLFEIKINVANSPDFKFTLGLNFF